MNGFKNPTTVIKVNPNQFFNWITNKGGEFGEVSLTYCLLTASAHFLHTPQLAAPWHHWFVQQFRYRCRFQERLTSPNLEPKKMPAIREHTFLLYVYRTCKFSLATFLFDIRCCVSPNMGDVSIHMWTPSNI